MENKNKYIVTIFNLTTNKVVYQTFTDDLNYNIEGLDLHLQDYETHINDERTIMVHCKYNNCDVCVNITIHDKQQEFRPQFGLSDEDINNLNAEIKLFTTAHIKHQYGACNADGITYDSIYYDYSDHKYMQSAVQLDVNVLRVLDRLKVGDDPKENALDQLNDIQYETVIDTIDDNECELASKIKRKLNKYKHDINITSEEELAKFKLFDDTYDVGDIILQHVQELFVLRIDDTDKYENVVTINTSLRTSTDNEFYYINSSTYLEFETLPDDDTTYKYGKCTDINDTYIKWLIESQDYSIAEFCNAYNTVSKDYEALENIKSKFLRTLVKECLNMPEGYPCELTFHTRMTIKEFAELKTAKQIIISTGTMCGFVDWINGSGSLLDIELEKDIILNTATTDENNPTFSIIIDTYCNGYNPTQIFGEFSDVAYEDGGIFNNNNTEV